MARYLVANGVDVSLKGHDKRTALHDACLKGCFEIVELPIDKGADVHVKYCSGLTALQLAARNDRPDVVNFIVKINK